MSINKAGEVAAIVSERMARIKIADGFETDIGQKIFRGRRKVSEDQVGTGCVSIIEGTDDVREQLGGRLAEARIKQLYGLVAYLRLRSDEEPNDAAHRALRDMKRVIWAGDATFGGKVRAVSYRGRDMGLRDDGVDIMVAVLEIEVEFVETLITP